MIQPLVSICSSLFYRVDCLLLRAVTAVKQEKKCSGASATSSFSQWTLQFLPDVMYTHEARCEEAQRTRSVIWQYLV